jgi:hypothetical protein
MDSLTLMCMLLIIGTLFGALIFLFFLLLISADV